MKGDKIYYRRGFKYQLEKCCSVQTDILWYDIKLPYIELTPAGLLSVFKGYAWDGASGPTIDTPSSMRGSLFHDALYQLLRLELISHKERVKADKLLRDICKEDGMWKWRADGWEKAVHEFGIFAADPEHEKPIIEAP